MMSSHLLALCLGDPAGQPGVLQAYPPTRSSTFAVTLDHFRFSLPEVTFNLRWLEYASFATAPDAPVLFYCGNEGAIETFYNASGGMFEIAQALSARLIFVEHRYYGLSLPFGVPAMSLRTCARFCHVSVR